MEFKALIQEIKKKSVRILTTEELTTAVESPLQIELIIAAIKAEKMDYALQKATELGVTSISPFFSARSVIKIDEKRREKRLLHWKNIIQSAAEQCGRRTIPDLHTFCSLNEVDISHKSSQFLVLDPNATKKMSDLVLKTRQMGLICGPEGGFTDEEVNRLISRGAKNINLGPRVLRAETASTCAISIAQYLWGDLKN